MNMSKSLILRELHLLHAKHDVDTFVLNQKRWISRQWNILVLYITKGSVSYLGLFRALAHFLFLGRGGHKSDFLRLYKGFVTLGSPAQETVVV